MDNYYAQKASILASQPAPQQSTLRANMGGIGVGVGLAGLFALMDVYQARSHSEMTMQEARDTVQYHKNVLSQLQSSNATQEELAIQMQNVSDAEAFLERTKVMNAKVERQADLGAAGMVTGTAIGAAIGSLIPVIGTMIGAMIGGILGQWSGSKLAEVEVNTSGKKGNPNWYKHSPLDEPAPSLGDFRREDENYSKTYSAETIRQNEESIRKGAAGIRRHARGYEEQPITLAEENAANAARESYLADERLKQQRIFGGRYVGDITPYTPKDAREEAALRSYDAHQIHGGAEGTFATNESVNQFKSNLDKMATTTAEWNNQQRQQVSTLQSLNDETKSTGILEGIGDFFDGLLFSKAAANSPTPDTNMEISRPPAQIETPKPEGGFFDNIELPNFDELFSNIELPNFGEKLSEMFANIEIPNLGEKIGELFNNIELPELPNFGEKLSEMFTNIDVPNLGEKIGELFSGIELP